MNPVGLTERRGQIIGQLSKGYRQRVGLAQALIHDPDVIVLDEPTAGLDPRQIIEIRELIRALGKEHTIILSTHILPEASMTCERLIVINDGEIAGSVRLSEGRAVSIDAGDGGHTELGDMKTLYLEVLGPETEVKNVLENLPGVNRVESRGLNDNVNPTFHVNYKLNTDIRAAVSSNIIQHGWSLLEMRSIEMTLEELFLQLTTNIEGDRRADDEEHLEV